MNCEELIGYLSDYIEDDLDEDLAQAARAHLATCRNCQVALNTTQGVILLGRGEGQRAIPAMDREALFTRLQKAFLGRPQGEPATGGGL